MVIDFHTHVFPPSIAARTMDSLSQVGGMKPHTDGTKEGLQASMRRDGIDISVVLPVATKPGQFASINSYACELNEEKNLISLGGIHPAMENWRDGIREIRRMGLLGIKIHPDYQSMEIDDERYIRILDTAAEENLLVVTHAGFDPLSPEHIHCPPEKILRVIRQVQGCRLILAHIGAMFQWDKVEEYLVGQDVYFDLSQLPHIPREQFRRIVTAHGADRLLFASDSPWVGQAETLSCLKQMGLTEDEEQKILYKNAEMLLGRR